MPRAVFFGLPAHGHTNPTLPLVRELVDRGEEVVYYSSEEFAERIRRAGAEFRPYRSPFLENFSMTTERLEQLPFLVMQATREVLDVELPALQAERFDYVIHDSVAPWGGCVADVLGLPSVLSITTFAFNRRVLMSGARVAPKRYSAIPAKIRSAMKAVRVRRGIRAAYGIRGPKVASIISHRPGLKIVYTSRFFQPFEETFDESFRFVGPSIAARGDGARFELPESGSGPIIYISMGTLFNDEADFYRACFEAFDGEDVRVVLSTGERARVEGAPPNFVVRDYVPQLEVLERASAFITRGGMNSVSESLYFGVPVVVIPHMGEQAIVAARVRALGAGVMLRKTQVTEEALHDLVECVLADERFARNARAIGDSFRSAGSFKRATDEILSSVGGSR